jgi:hypothetical protein
MEVCWHTQGWAVRVSGFDTDRWLDGDDLCAWVINGVVTLQSWMEHSLKSEKYVRVPHHWTLSQDTTADDPIDTKQSNPGKNKGAQANHAKETEGDVVGSGDKPVVAKVPDEKLMTFVVNPTQELIEKAKAVADAAAAAADAAHGKSAGKAKGKH